MTLPLSILDLAPVPDGRPSQMALRHLVDLARLGDKLGYILTFNEVYFDFAVPPLQAAGIDPAGPPPLIAAGDGSESAYQRIRNGPYQIATRSEERR